MRSAVICYLPPLDVARRYVAKYGATETFRPTHYLSDVLGWPMETVECGPVLSGELEGCRSSTRAANYSWIYAIRHAIKTGLDYFLFTEVDCGYSCAEWDTQAWLDFERNSDYICAGTPMGHFIIHNPKWEELWLPFSARCHAETGVVAGLQDSVAARSATPAIYPNGALAIYRTASVAEAFRDVVADMRRIPEMRSAWDLSYGWFLVQKYGAELLDRFCFTPVMYSSCGEFGLSVDEKMARLSSGQLTAAHSVCHD